MRYYEAGLTPRLRYLKGAWSCPGIPADQARPLRGVARLVRLSLRQAHVAVERHQRGGSPSASQEQADALQVLDDMAGDTNVKICATSSPTGTGRDPAACIVKRKRFKRSRPCTWKISGCGASSKSSLSARSWICRRRSKMAACCAPRQRRLIWPRRRPRTRRAGIRSQRRRRRRRVRANASATWRQQQDAVVKAAVTAGGEQLPARGDGRPPGETTASEQSEAGGPGCRYRPCRRRDSSRR